METLIRGLEVTFAYFGGVPEELLLDQMQAVMIDDLRGEGGSLILNAEFLRFAERCGFQPEPAGRTGARAKGKIERGSATVARASSTRVNS